MLGAQYSDIWYQSAVAHSKRFTERYASHLDFEEFARRIGIQEKRIGVLLEPFLERQPLVEQLIGRSYLEDSLKKGYLLNYNKKRNLLG